jgi:signal transduction histidine kinase
MYLYRTEMTSSNIVERLAKHRTIGSAPRPELEWLAAHGSVRHLNAGDVLVASGGPVEALFVVLSGRMTIFRGAGPRKIVEWREGDVTGLLPYSRVAGSPGDVIADEPTDIFSVAGTDFPALMRDCHALTEILIHTMLDRARAFKSVDLRDEKIMALGKLSAVVTHELNNPAAAIERSAALIAHRIEESERATRVLCHAHLDEPQLAALDEIQAACVSNRLRGVRSPLQQAEREEALGDWLSSRGLDVAIADALSETTVTLEALDRLASAVQPSVLNEALRWAAAACSVRSLASEIQEAATRISRLVAAAKRFTHMDQADVPESVDVAKGIDDTVTLLRSKALKKSATISVDIESGLPNARGFAGELSQIWMNLIDNALDAIPDSGRVDIGATHERQRVVVRVIDNGNGIPEEIRDSIFVPYFTTKPIGEGTGLGLDTAQNLVRHNGGNIRVDSRPGRTEFRVELPVAAPGGATS